LQPSGRTARTLALELVADHLRHAQPYEHGCLSEVRYRGLQIAVTNMTELNETHVFAAAEARSLGEEVRTRTRGRLQG